MDFESLERNLRELKLNELVVQAALKHEAEIVDLNTSQLEKGKLSTGANIDPKYSSKLYTGFKKSIGSKVAPIPDLKVEGNYYSGKYLEGKGEFLIFGSKDSKADKLEKKYSVDIEGLTDANWSNSIEIFSDDLIDLINEHITAD
jgi:hypothetical protein